MKILSISLFSDSNFLRSYILVQRSKTLMIQSNVGDICMPNLIIRLETIFRDRLIEINLALKKVKKSYCELSVF